MRTNLRLVGVLLSLAWGATAAAEDHADGIASNAMMQEHGGAVFHMFRLETSIGSNHDKDTLIHWDAKGWVGTDENKLYLKTEGERKDNTIEHAELWALYSRNISTFWDAQVGVRYDFKPASTAYLTLGFNGLAPQWFETEAHLFIGTEGNLSARLFTENDFLITQHLILQPYAEANLFAQDVKAQNVGTGLADGTIGMQTRYEITRSFAPYIDLHYTRKFGDSASISKSIGESIDETVGMVGLRLMF